MDRPEVDAIEAGAPGRERARGAARRWPGWLILLAYAAVLRGISIAGGQLSGHDEPRVAGIAREMAVGGGWSVPRLDGEPFLEYPPLGYWPVAASLAIGGRPSELLANLPIAVLGLATALLTYRIGAVLAGEGVGLAAGLILSTMSGFFILSRRCLVDPTLVCAVTLSFAGLAQAIADPCGRRRSAAPFWLGLGLGFLAKGLIGAAIPAAAAVALIAWRRDRALLGRLRPLSGAVLAAAPIALWTAAAWRAEGSAAVGEVLRQSAWRFASPTADHADPARYLYYLEPLLANVIPWLLLPVPLIIDRLIAWRRGKAASPAESSGAVAFALIWLLVVLGGLSAASAKRVVYLGPVYPAFALLAALGWGRVRAWFPWSRRIEAPALALVLAALAGVHFLKLLPDERAHSFRPVFETVEREAGTGAVALYGMDEGLRGAAVFYLGRTVPVLDGPAALARTVAEDPPRAIVAPILPAGDPAAGALDGAGYRVAFEKKTSQPQLRVYVR